MPFRVEVSKAEGIARVTAVGRIEIREIQEHMVRMKKMGWAGLSEIIDVTRAETVTLSMRDLLSLARFAFGEFGSGYMAARAVVVSSRRHFEWARIFAALVSGWMSVGVFTDRREALLWLDHQRRRIPAEAARRAASG